MRSRRALLVLSLTVLWPSGAVATDAPVPVSPVNESGLARVGHDCPTFHWGSAAGALSIELVVYRLPQSESGGDLEPVTRVVLPGSANGWTPSLDRCLESGGRYAWSLRAVGRKKASRWSDPRLFEVTAGPTRDELDQALALLRRDRDESTEAPEIRAAGRKLDVGESAPPPRPPRRHPEGPTGEPLGTRAAPTLGAASLSVDGQIHLGAASAVFKEDRLLLQSDTATASVSLGDGALDENFGAFNTAVGAGALTRNEGDDVATPVLEGSSNTAVGYFAMFDNETGSLNTALGAGALANNLGDDPATSPQLEGSANTAVGYRALHMNTLGWRNTGVGNGTLRSNKEGDLNVGVGADALAQNENGDLNVAVGDGALRNLNGGKLNVAIGASAGSTLGDAVNPENSNILLNNLGFSGESNTLRIGEFTGAGDRGLQAAYIHGIHGKTLDQDTAMVVFVDSTGKLGTEPGAPAAAGAGPPPRALTAPILQELERLRREIRELQAKVSLLEDGRTGG